MVLWHRTSCDGGSQASLPARSLVPNGIWCGAACPPDTKQTLEDQITLKLGRFHADKAYINADWAEPLMKNHALELFTLGKKRKGDILISDSTFSTFFSSVHQPIDCFFNWLNLLPKIQFASTIRSLSSLRFRVFGCIATALIFLVFNPWLAFAIFLYLAASTFFDCH